LVYDDQFQSKLSSSNPFSAGVIDRYGILINPITVANTMTSTVLTTGTHYHYVAGTQGGTETGSMVIDTTNGTLTQAYYFSNPNLGDPHITAPITGSSFVATMPTTIDSYGAIQLQFAASGNPAEALRQSADGQIAIGFARSGTPIQTTLAVAAPISPWQSVADAYGSYFIVNYQRDFSGSMAATLDVYANGTANLQPNGGALEPNLTMQVDSYGFMHEVYSANGNLLDTFVPSADGSIAAIDGHGAALGLLFRKHTNAVSVNNRTFRYWNQTSGPANDRVLPGSSGPFAETGLVHFNSNGMTITGINGVQMVQGGQSCGYGLPGTGACANAGQTQITISGSIAGGDATLTMSDPFNGTVYASNLPGYISANGTVAAFDLGGEWLLLADTGETVPGYSYLEATHDPSGFGSTEFGFINFLDKASPFEARYMSDPNVVPATFAAVGVNAAAGGITSTIDAYGVARFSDGSGAPGYELHRSSDGQLVMGLNRSSSVPATMAAVTNAPTPLKQVADAAGSYFFALHDYMTYSGSDVGTIDIYADGTDALSGANHSGGATTPISGTPNYQVDSYGYLHAMRPAPNQTQFSHTIMLSADRSVGLMEESGSQIGFVIKKHSNAVTVNNRTLRYWSTYNTSPSTGVAGTVGAQGETGLIQFDNSGQGDFSTAITQLVQNGKSCGFGLAGSNACSADATAPLIQITSQGVGGDIYVQLIDSATSGVVDSGYGYISQSGAVAVVEWASGNILTLMDSGEIIPTSSGIIEGFVSNSYGQTGPIRVEIYDNSGVVSIVTVDGNGQYRFNNVAPGSYGITAFVDANNDGTWQWQTEAASDARVPAGQASIQLNISGSSVGQSGNVINGYSIAYGLDVVGISSGIYGHVTNSSGVAGTVLVDSVLAATATADGQSTLDSYGNYALIGLGSADWYARAFVDINGNNSWNVSEPVAVSGNITINSYGAGQQYLRNLVIMDTAGPSVTAPASILVIAPDIYGSPSTDTYITAFLAGATATDNVGVVSQYNNAPTKFPLGRTTVTFSALDAAGNLGTATSFVDVYTYINGVLAAGRPVAGGTLTVNDLY
ncbi:MAG: hypothetical protein R8J85_09325, partial [Mariprofundales bacterium]